MKCLAIAFTATENHCSAICADSKLFILLMLTGTLPSQSPSLLAPSARQASHCTSAHSCSPCRLFDALFQSWPSSGQDFALFSMVGVEPGEVEASRYQEYRPEYRSGGFTVCGIRDTLEDALVCIDDLEEHLGSRGAFYGVFDGHDGSAAALYAKERLLPLILQDAQFPASAEAAVKNEYLRLDMEFLEACKEDNSLYSGTTALIALLQARNLLVANAGDCRAVLCRKGKAIPMSVDHDPRLLGEKLRIESAHGFVTSDGYVNGQLTVARAIGDWHMPGLKERDGSGPVIAEPEIQTLVLSEDDEFLVMGCDGFWDVFTNEAAISFARRHLQQHNDPELCAEELVNEALRRNSQDNVTVITISFRADPPPSLVVIDARSTTRSLRRESIVSLQNDLDIAQASTVERRFHFE